MASRAKLTMDFPPNIYLPTGNESRVSIMAAVRKGDLGFGGSIRALQAFRDVIKIANSEKNPSASNQTVVQKGAENAAALEEMMNAFYSQLVSIEGSSENSLV